MRCGSSMSLLQSRELRHQGTAWQQLLLVRCKHRAAILVRPALAQRTHSTLSGQGWDSAASAGQACRRMQPQVEQLGAAPNDTQDSLSAPLHYHCPPPATAHPPVFLAAVGCTQHADTCSCGQPTRTYCPSSSPDVVPATLCAPLSGCLQHEQGSDSESSGAHACRERGPLGEWPVARVNTQPATTPSEDSRTNSRRPRVFFCRDKLQLAAALHPTARPQGNRLPSTLLGASDTCTLSPKQEEQLHNTRACCLGVSSYASWHHCWCAQGTHSHPHSTSSAACVLARYPLGVSTPALSMQCTKQRPQGVAPPPSLLETMPCCCLPVRLTRHTRLRAKNALDSSDGAGQQTDLFFAPTGCPSGRRQRVFRRLHITQTVQGPFRCTYAYAHSAITLHDSSAGTSADSAPRFWQAYTGTAESSCTAASAREHTRKGRQPSSCQAITAEAQVPRTHAQEKCAGPTTFRTVSSLSLAAEQHAFSDAERRTSPVGQHSAPTARPRAVSGRLMPKGDAKDGLSHPGWATSHVAWHDPSAFGRQSLCCCGRRQLMLAPARRSA